MRVPLEDIIAEIQFRLANNKDGLKAKVYLQDALNALQEYKKHMDAKKL